MDEFCIKSDGFCIKSDEFCVSNDEVWRNNLGGRARLSDPGRSSGRSAAEFTAENESRKVGARKLGRGKGERIAPPWGRPGLNISPS